MSGTVIAITGGKGGVGKSTTTINLGVSLRMDGYSVALVDADVEMPNLVEMLSLEADHTIHDVLSGDAETADAIVQIGEGFVAIPGDSSLMGYGAIEPERLHQVVDTLAEQYDYVILDTGAGLSYDDLFPIGLADEIVLVSSPDGAAIENAKRTHGFVQRLNRQVRGLVITKADSSVDPEIAKDFETKLLGVIPEDQHVRRSTSVGEPLEVHAPSSEAAQAYRQLEANLTNGVLPPKRKEPEPEAEEPADEEDTETFDPEDEEASEEEEPAPAEAEELEDDTQKQGLFARLMQFFTRLT